MLEPCDLRRLHVSCMPVLHVYFTKAVIKCERREVLELEFWHVGQVSVGVHQRVQLRHVVEEVLEVLQRCAFGYLLASGSSCGVRAEGSLLPLSRCALYPRQI